MRLFIYSASVLRGVYGINDCRPILSLIILHTLLFLCLQRIVLLSVLGPVGAALEVVLILYLIAASLLGCYSLPLVARIRPRPHDTPMVHVIANCVVVLMLSSALPLLARTLGNDGGIFVFLTIRKNWLD